MKSDIQQFLEQYPDIKYPVWKAGDRFYLNSRKADAEAYAAKTGQVVEMVEKPAPKPSKGKKSEKITEDGTE